MVKPFVFPAFMLIASSALGMDWQRPDCSAYESFSECRNAEINSYRQSKQREFRDSGLSFWYYERPDYSENQAVKKAMEDKLEGALVFRFDVLADGSVANAVLKQQSSSEVGVYVEPLLVAIKNWQFVPADRTWEGLEWRYQFFFEPESCGDEVPTGSCDENSES